MAEAETVRFVSTITVIFIVLMLQYLYKTRYKKYMENSRINITGVLIMIGSIALAIIWMWRS